MKQSGGSAKFAHLFTTDTFPYDNADTRDLALEETGGKLSNEGGIVLRIVDIPRECPARLKEHLLTALTQPIPILLSTERNLSTLA